MKPPPIYRLQEGASKLLVSIPHAGTFIPDSILHRLTPAGRAVIDTDWHVDRLYDFLADMDVTTIIATHSRTVADLNRSPEGALLYPGQAETALCPKETFAGAPLYAGAPPDAGETAERVELYWRPYHAEIERQLSRLRARHGTAHMLDGHSIRGEVPRLFAGSLPDLNFGTDNGRSCGTALVQAALHAADGSPFSRILNGRFKGGYITRHYGAPDHGVHVIQLELAQRAYLVENAPESYEPARAADLIMVLRRVVEALLRA